MVLCVTLAGCHHAASHDAQPLAGDSPSVAPSAPESAPSIETALALETFDAAWQLVNDTHFDPHHNGVDWLSVREELRPRAETATTEKELRKAIGEMLSRLGQSHFVLLPREAVDALDPKKLAGPDAPQSERSDGNRPEVVRERRPARTASPSAHPSGGAPGPVERAPRDLDARLHPSAAWPAGSSGLSRWSRVSA